MDLEDGSRWLGAVDTAGKDWPTRGLECGRHPDGLDGGHRGQGVDGAVQLALITDRLGVPSTVAAHATCLLRTQLVAVGAVRHSPQDLGVPAKRPHEAPPLRRIADHLSETRLPDSQR